MNYIETAVKMEKATENYYLEQAEKNKDNVLHSVFIRLAEEEKKHGEILKERLKNVSYALEETEKEWSFQEVFDATEKKLKENVKVTPAQIDGYRGALEGEIKSKELYQSLKDAAENEKEKELFSYLVKQEQAHIRIIEEMIQLLKRADEWVESAEFGVRDDY